MWDDLVSSRWSGRKGKVVRGQVHAWQRKIMDSYKLEPIGGKRQSYLVVLPSRLDPPRIIKELRRLAKKHIPKLVLFSIRRAPRSGCGRRWPARLSCGRAGGVVRVRRWEPPNGTGRSFGTRLPESKRHPLRMKAMSEQTTPLLRERGLCEHCAGDNHKAHTETYVQAGVEYPASVRVRWGRCSRTRLGRNTAPRMALPVLDEEELLPDFRRASSGSGRTRRPRYGASRRCSRRGRAWSSWMRRPGAGKSLIAESVRRRLKVQALYLTQTKQLQDQMARSYPYARVIKGRDNYPTLDDSYRTAKDCDMWRKKCVAKPARGCVVTGGAAHCSWCHPTLSCAYTLAKSAALHAPLAVANTSYAFLEWGAQGQFKDWPLVILDEWDQVEDVLFNTLNVEITAREMGRFKLTHPGRADEGWVREAAKAVGEVYSQSADNPPDDWPRIGELAIGLRRAAEGLKDGSWIVLGQDPMAGVSVGPIEVGKLGQQYLWPHGKRWLLMSGTAIDIRLRLSKLGWTDFGSKGQPGKGRVLQVPSVYPVANRPVRVWPVAPMVRGQAGDVDPEDGLRHREDPGRSCRRAGADPQRDV